MPYEHVVGIVNACAELGLISIEFSAGPSWEDVARRSAATNPELVLDQRKDGTARFLGKIVFTPDAEKNLRLEFLLALHTSVRLRASRSWPFQHVQAITIRAGKRPTTVQIKTTKDE